MKNVYSQNQHADFLNSEDHKLQEEIEMTKNSVGPSEWTIQKILGFSAAFEVQPSNLLGRFEQLKN
jgi:hypothetical protein